MYEYTSIHSEYDRVLNKPKWNANRRVFKPEYTSIKVFLICKGS